MGSHTVRPAQTPGAGSTGADRPGGTVLTRCGGSHTVVLARLENPAPALDGDGSARLAPFSVPM